MALFEEIFEGWGGIGLAGFGIVLTAPLLLPVVGSVLRPMAKGLIWGALTVTAGTREWLAEAGEQVSDLYAEARDEFNRGRTAEPAAPRLVTPAGQPAGGA
jgi:Protein of unknown function (DUF5132)